MISCCGWAFHACPVKVKSPTTTKDSKSRMTLTGMDKKCLYSKRLPSKWMNKILVIVKMRNVDQLSG